MFKSKAFPQPPHLPPFVKTFELTESAKDITPGYIYKTDVDLRIFPLNQVEWITIMEAALTGYPPGFAARLSFKINGEEPYDMDNNGPTPFWTNVTVKGGDPTTRNSSKLRVNKGRLNTIEIIIHDCSPSPAEIKGKCKILVHS